jgi:hypothetical protein
VTAQQQFWLYAPPGADYIVPPSAFFIEDFEAGLTPYTTVSGNPGLWSIVASPYGIQCLQMDAITGGGVNAVKRSIPSTAFNRMQMKFRVTAINTDDSGVVTLKNATIGLLTIIPMREGAFDAARRIRVSYTGGAVYLGTVAITVSEWYRITIKIAAGTLASEFKVTKESDGSTFSTTAFTSASATWLADEFHMEDSNEHTSTETEFDDIYLYNE